MEAVATSTVTEPDHPAKFSPTVQRALAKWIDLEGTGRGRDGLVVCDPFAGVGRIHRLPYVTQPFTVGVELEALWALPGGSIPGDATRLPFRCSSVDVVATSPCYGNRLADTYDGSRDTCTDCRGSGLADVLDRVPCRVCAGTGKASSRRYSYRISLGQPLSEGSAAGMQWGPAYRRLHAAAWVEVYRVLTPGGLLLVNLSDHIRDGSVVPVAEWHLVTLLRLGFLLVEVAPLLTPRMRHGANHDLRVGAEMLVALRMPGTP